MEPLRVEYACPACGGSRRAPASIVGERRTCPHCGARTLIPADARPATPRPPRPALSPDGIDASATEPETFVVRYVEPVSQRLDALTDGAKFRLAVAATAGAEVSAPRQLGHDSCTSAAFSIDGEDRFECTLAATPANVTALEATGFPWSPAARDLAGRVGASAQPVEEVRAAVAEAERAWAARVAASSERTPDTGQAAPPPTPSPPPASGSWLPRWLRRLIRRRGEPGGGAVQRP